MKYRRAAICLAPFLLFICAGPAKALGPLIVFFATSSEVVSRQGQAILQNTIQAFAPFSGEPGAGIVLVGHTDRAGARAANLRLSCRRAASVRAFLITLGMSPDRIAMVGRGEEMPLVDTADGIAEAQNRRVELTFADARGIAAARAGPDACGDQIEANGG